MRRTGNKMLKELIEMLENTKEIDSIQNAFLAGEDAVGAFGLSSSNEALFYMALKAKTNKPLFVVTDQAEGEILYGDLEQWMGKKVAFLPKRQLLPYRTYLKSREIKDKRLAILKDLIEGKIDILLLTEETLSDKYVPKDLFLKDVFTLKVGESIGRDRLIEQLVHLGYSKEPLVENRAQFSIRGDIVDIFVPTDSHPIRIDFFDDEIEEIKHFDLEDQQTIVSIKKADIFATTDLPLQNGQVDEAIKTLKAYTHGVLREEIQTLSEGMYTEEKERFFPAFFPELVPLTAYSKKKPVMVFRQYDTIKNNQGIFLRENEETLSEGIADGLIHPIQEETYFKEDFARLFKDWDKVFSYLFYSTENALAFKTFVRWEKSLIPSFLGEIDFFIKEMKNYLTSGDTIYLFATDENKKKGLEKLMRSHGLVSEQIRIEKGYLGESFRLPALHLVCIGDKTIFGQIKQGPKKKKKEKKKKLDPFIDIKVGDYIVHEEYGIAQYEGIESKEILGIRKDYLKLTFSGSGRLFIPVDNIEAIEKYIGGEGHHPRLSNLGTNDWKKTKEKVRVAVSDTAKDLLKLYSERKLAKGFAFSEDTPWQKAFEDKFPYQETEDQLKAINDVKGDMEKSTPMDRIIIGDVGYGKTEVALRAAFKAAIEGKQVAMLSPTTVLSQQHYETFIRRFDDFPIRIGLLNRFVSKKKQKEVIDDLGKGQVDILIGTHRLLSKDVVFKDLGLLIVDEEQKFGVTHKERLKAIKNNIDSLALSATPIPRTLHMALAGARDLSVIETAPKERYPVQTYVLAHDLSVVRNSILKEKKRNGQTYYLYNTVKNIEDKKRMLESLVPEVTIAIAHGQMDEKTLEKNMLDFFEGRTDVLLCTTLIENGLNIKNANTLIIENADQLGLSQIYQIKGRIGRSNKVASAYFMFQGQKVLSENATKRLQAIKELTQLGSGFKIAMLDLEIRGAGNLLGKEQHGHMLSVGFDLYCKILDEEVRRLSGELEEEPKRGEPIVLPMDIEAYLPDEYVAIPSVKVALYKKMANVEDEDGLADLRKEIIDRFGPMPEVVAHLFLVAHIRLLAGRLNIEKIGSNMKGLIFTFKKDENTLEKAKIIKNTHKKQIAYEEKEKIVIYYTIDTISGESLLAFLEMLDKLVIKGQGN